MAIQSKRVDLRLKSIGEDGTFSGHASVFGNRDLGGDVILPGAFAKSIQDHGVKFPLLDEHWVNVGVASVEEDKSGLATAGKLNLETQAARDLHSNMKFYQAEGLPYGMSIGYLLVPDKVELKENARYLKEVKLEHIATTTQPMNEAARVSAVKRLALEQKADFATELEAAQTWAQGYQAISALDNALYSIIWDEEKTAEAKIEAAGESIDQFKTTYLEFLPKLLALMDSRFKSTVAEFEQKEGRALFATARVEEAEKTFRALLEGAAQSAEPAIDHSLLESISNLLKGE